MPLNTKFDQNLFDNVKEILKPLPYINDVCFDFPRGEFIDLNVFRKGFEDWIAGKLTDDQAVLIRTTNIISLYEQHFKPELIDKYATGNVSSSTWLFAPQAHCPRVFVGMARSTPQLGAEIFQGSY